MIVRGEGRVGISGDNFAVDGGVQGGANLLGFDFVQLGVGDLFGRDVEFAGGQLAVLVGVDAVEERGDELADGEATYLGSECAGEVGVDNAFADFSFCWTKGALARDGGLALERDGGLAIKRL